MPVGAPIANHLLQDRQDLTLIIGSRELERAQKVADELNEDFENPDDRKRVDAVQVDLSSKTGLEKALKEATALVMMNPSWMQWW